MPFYTARGDLEFEDLSDGGLCITYEYDDGAYYQVPNSLLSVTLAPDDTAGVRQTPWTNVTDAQWQRLFDSDSRAPKVYNFTAAQTDRAGWHNRDYYGTGFKLTSLWDYISNTYTYR